MSACDDATVIGPFNDGEVIKFMGASVSSLQSTIGWNGGTSQVNIDVYEDCDDSFIGKAGGNIDKDKIGTPQEITVGNFYFAGIIQSIQKVESFTSFPAYQIVLVSPIGLLEGTQLIIGAYNGSIKFSGQRIPNLLNIFGYLEAGIFGFSGVNDGGMYWDYGYNSYSGRIGIKSAVEELTGYAAISSPYTNSLGAESEVYGGSLQWRGYSYKVNLDNVPHLIHPDPEKRTPQYYRIGNQSISLLECISQVCRDGGFEFFVNLTLTKDPDGSISTSQSHEISIQAISRREQPELGEVNSFIQNNTRYRSSSSQGMEFRDDYVSAFLLGSMVEELSIVADSSKIKQFWGYDENGVPILDEEDDITFEVGEDGETITVPFRRMTLNATPISEILGQNGYTCTTVEMLCALGSMESWVQWKKAVQGRTSSGLTTEQFIGTQPEFMEDLPVIYERTARAYKDFYDRMNTRDSERVLPFDAVDENKIKEHTQRLYEFVRSYAQEFYGKKFLVALNNVSIKLDSDTGERQYSHAIISAAYIGDGGRPLDISSSNAILFLDQTNRCAPMARTTTTPSAYYYTQRSPDDAVVETDGTATRIYHRVSVAEYFVDYEQFGFKLWAEVTLGECAFENPSNPWGYATVLQALMGTTEEEFLEQLKVSQESLKMTVNPLPIYVDAFAIPLRNNTVVYGPWGQFPDTGVTGRCYLEIDDSLNPWTYEIGLNTIAQQKIQNAITNLQVVENGVIQVAGTPDKSLGESLTDGGNLYLTGVDINYGIQGVETIYKIQTYTPRFGVFSFGNADRMRRLTDASQKQRRALREQIRKRKQRGDLSPGTKITVGLWQNAMESFYMHSPKSVLVSELIEDTDEETYYSTVSLSTAKEALALLPKEPEDYKRFAVASLDAIFAPIRIASCDDEEPGTGVIPCKDADGEEISQRRFSIWGNPPVSERDTQRSFYRNQSADAYSRGYTVGLRAPIFLSGWAKSAFKYNAYLPSEDENLEDKTIGEVDGYDRKFLRNESYSKSGALEVFWDHKREMFVCPGFVLIGNVTSTNPLKVAVTNHAVEEDEMTVISPLGSVDVNQTVAMMRGPDGYWYIIAASCSS